MATGTGDNNRIGNQINVISITVKWTYIHRADSITNVNDGDGIVRLALLWDKAHGGSSWLSLSPSTIYYDAGAALYGTITSAQRKRYWHVINTAWNIKALAYLGTVDPLGARLQYQERFIQFQKPLKITFSDTTADSGSTGATKNSLGIGIWTTTTRQDDQCIMYTLMRYTDA